MALPKQGSRPQARPFHLGLPETSAYCHKRLMAVAHSITHDTWMAHVGKESALLGSAAMAWLASGKARAKAAQAGRVRDATRRTGEGWWPSPWHTELLLLLQLVLLFKALKAGGVLLRRSAVWLQAACRCLSRPIGVAGTWLDLEGAAALNADGMIMLVLE